MFQLRAIDKTKHKVCYCSAVVIYFFNTDSGDGVGMAQTLGEVGLAAELWTPAVQQRFDSLFAVAARKSWSLWRLVPRGDAQMLVVDGSQPISAGGEKAPCVLYIGGSAQSQPLGRSSQRWAAHLDVNFTLGDLIDMLDRAAVFLMDWKARQQANNSQSLQKAIGDLQTMGMDCPHRFQIKAWITLPSPYNAAESLRALALLSRGHIDARALCEHSGITTDQAVRLLSLPQVQRVLRVSLQGTSDAQNSSSRSAGKQAAPVTRSWVKKLTGWITRGGNA